MPAIADITGYTQVLAGSELDHAQDIPADLTNNVVASLRPTLRLAKLEGNAFFVYVITEAVDDEACSARELLRAVVQVQ